MSMGVYFLGSALNCPKWLDFLELSPASSVMVFDSGLLLWSSGWLFVRHLRLFRLHLLDDPSYWYGFFQLFYFRLFCPGLCISSRLSSLPCLTCHLADSRHFRHLPEDFPIGIKILGIWLCYSPQSTPALKNGIMAQGWYSQKHPCISKRNAAHRVARMRCRKIF